MCGLSCSIGTYGGLLGKMGEATQSYIDPDTMPSYSEECATCAQAGSCNSTCRNNYITEASHPDEVPYVGWLKSFAFLSEAERTNPDLGPSDWIYQSMSDGVLAQCAASNTSEWLLGWNKEQRQQQETTLDGFAQQFTDSGYSFAHWFEPSSRVHHTGDSHDFWIIACGSTEKETSSINVVPEEETPIEVVDEEVGQSDLEENSVQSGRTMKRMTIAQVRDSMEQITGTRWGGNTSKWDTYSDSLGVPDFQQRMEPDLSPSVVFQKFLNDAAAESCTEWMEEARQCFPSIRNHKT